MRASIDLLSDKLERQVVRYREKRRHRGHGHGHSGRGSGPASEAGVPLTLDDGRRPEIVKTKQFALRPMSPEEAVLELELVGHDFFLFRRDDVDQINVVYRRRGGGYGLIEPS